ncbi:MAG TPA: hypothetical protein VGR11_13320, partial [Solirubrobacteraceae bacterium]|nr:hypothetical protein [Solirubrobacteraceae bacterium]
MRVATVEIWQGASAVLEAVAYIEGLIAAGRPIREVVFDPMRFWSEALRLERDHGLTLTEWPQSTGPHDDLQRTAAVAHRGG